MQGRQKSLKRKLFLLKSKFGKFYKPQTSNLTKN